MENGELIAPGGIRACLASSMAQLRHKTKGAKELGGKVLAIPSLQEIKTSKHG